MVEACCFVTPSGRVAPQCPETGRPTKVIDVFTVQHHALPALVGRVRDEAYGFCDDPACDVVYVGSGGHLLRKSDLRTRVGLKEAEPPIPVCYCWSFTTTDVEEDVRAHGDSTIIPYITERVKQDLCACHINNPAGRCCLGEVTKAVLRAKKLVRDLGPCPACGAELEAADAVETSQ